MTIEQLQCGIKLFNKIDEIEGGIYRLNNNDISINSGGTCVTRCFNSEEIAQVKTVSNPL